MIRKTIASIKAATGRAPRGWMGGSSANSAAFSFSTLALPGDCEKGATPNVLYQYGFESGAAGWTHSGTGDTWALSTANPHGGTQAFHATDPAAVSDQRLVSPPIGIPPGNAPVVMSFWNWLFMETMWFTNDCYDGGILEISTNGGTTWTQVPDTSLMTDPYDGVIDAANPLGGLYAWCGINPQPYLNSIVDISSYAGQTVQFRFRLGTDPGSPGRWR